MSTAFIGKLVAMVDAEGNTQPTPEGPVELLMVAHDGMLTTYGSDGVIMTSPLTGSVVWDTNDLDIVDVAEAHDRARDWQHRNRYPDGVPVPPNELGRPF